MRLVVFLFVFVVGGFFVAVLGGFGCNGGAGGSVELREGYWTCFLIYLIPYCLGLWFTAKWAFKKQ